MQCSRLIEGHLLIRVQIVAALSLLHGTETFKTTLPYNLPANASVHVDPSLWVSGQAERNAIDFVDPGTSFSAYSTIGVSRGLKSQDSSQICAIKELYCGTSDVFIGDAKSALGGPNCTLDQGGIVHL